MSPFSLGRRAGDEGLAEIYPMNFRREMNSLVRIHLSHSNESARSLDPHPNLSQAGEGKRTVDA
jgi:hypothetical protein